MSIQIKTTEGIVTLSNATDVRETGVLCVRGHKGITLGFIAPLPKGGWVLAKSLTEMESYLGANLALGDSNDLSIQEIVAYLVQQEG